MRLLRDYYIENGKYHSLKLKFHIETFKHPRLGAQLT